MRHVLYFIVAIGMTAGMTAAITCCKWTRNDISHNEQIILSYWLESDGLAMLPNDQTSAQRPLLLGMILNNGSMIKLTKTGNYEHIKLAEARLSEIKKKIGNCFSVNEGYYPKLCSPSYRINVSDGNRRASLIWSKTFSKPAPGDDFINLWTFLLKDFESHIPDAPNTEHNSPR